MHLIRPRLLQRLPAIALVALLFAGCSVGNPAAAVDKVYEQARDLGQSLSEAAAATQDAKTGFAEPAFAARSIERASVESRELAGAASKVQQAPIRNLAADLVSVANRTVMALSSGNVEQAERIRTGEFVPLASELADLRRTLPVSATASEPPSIGSNLTVAVFVVAAIIGGVLIYLRRQAAEVSTPEASKRAAPSNMRPGEAAPSDSLGWDAPDPLSKQAAPADDADAYRSTKVRPIEIELGELLGSTLEQVKDRGWDVTLVGPSVHISGDPIRVQRAVLAALGNVYLARPERVGIVVEEDAGHVKLSIGHDAPMDEATTEDLAVRLANQLELALATPDLEWTAAYDNEISLISVGLGAAIATSSTSTAAV